VCNGLDLSPAARTLRGRKLFDPYVASVRPLCFWWGLWGRAKLLSAGLWLSNWDGVLSILTTISKHGKSAPLRKFFGRVARSSLGGPKPLNCATYWQACR